MDVGIEKREDPRVFLWLFHVPLGLEFRGHFKFYGDIEFWSLELRY